MRAAERSFDHAGAMRANIGSVAAADALVAAIERLGGAAHRHGTSAALVHPSGRAEAHEEIELLFFVRAWQLEWRAGQDPAGPTSA
jgi:hypothetical protein